MIPLTEVGAVAAQLLGGHGQLDRLEQRVGGGAHVGVRRRRPVSEREEANPLHLDMFPHLGSTRDATQLPASLILDAIAFTDLSKSATRASTSAFAC